MSVALRFFEVDSSHSIQPLQVNRNGPELTISSFEGTHTIWASTIRFIYAILSDKFVLSSGDNDPVICILFVRMKHLQQGSRFFYNLTHPDCCLRYTYPLNISNKRKFQKRRENISKIMLHPIITIGVTDITRIYEEAPGLDFDMPHLVEYWQNIRQQHTLLYKLNLDHRVKFLDSSIWHRYLAIKETFKKDFLELYNNIVENIRLALYQSVAACATLEFQCRMLKNSFIANYGDKGHNEAVTPFKFHSETQMAQKSRNFYTFFGKEYNGARLCDLTWDVLIIDDHANTALTYVLSAAIDLEDKNPIPGITKLELIKMLLTNSNGILNTSNEQEIVLNLNFHYTEGNYQIIKKGRDKISNREGNSIDIILLDYLLGKNNLDLDGRAYGHEFLLELATSHDNAGFRRGPMGRFWIYPISSFPFAFGDKLRQMNMDGSNERWYISSGGDPITTPELFRLNFLRLMLKQINEFYLHGAALVRWADRLVSIKDKRAWCEALYLQIEVEKNRKAMLASFREDSVFSNSIERFLEKQENEYYKFLNDVELWIYDLQEYQLGASPFALIQKLRDIGSGSDRFRPVCGRLEEQVRKFTFDAPLRLTEIALDAKKNNQNIIKYEDSRKVLYEFPKDLFTVHPDIKGIDLTNNQLTEIPDVFEGAAKLEKLILTNNPISKFPARSVLQHCANLRYLDLEGTEIAKVLKEKNIRAFAQQREKIHDLLHEIDKTIASDHVKSKPGKTGLSAFISYSNKDDDARKRLDTHLATLKREGLINTWHDGQTLPGQIWDAEIKKNLGSADIVFLLVSADFMASEYIWEYEIPETLARHARKECIVIPVYVNYCDTGQLGIVEFQGVPKGPTEPIAFYNNPEKGWYEVVTGIRKLIESRIEKQPR